LLFFTAAVVVVDGGRPGLCWAKKPLGTPGPTPDALGVVVAAPSDFGNDISLFQKKKKYTEGRRSTWVGMVVFVSFVRRALMRQKKMKKKMERVFSDEKKFFCSIAGLCFFFENGGP
jgi:hypothetical protein